MQDCILCNLPLTGYFGGSETHNGLGQEYVWLANQFGHTFIGFGGVFLFVWIVSLATKKPVPTYTFKSDISAQDTFSLKWIRYIAVVWLSIWLFKEYCDFSAAREQSETWVKPYLTDLISDVATDGFFYFAGVTLALAHYGLLRTPPFIVFLILLVFGAAPLAACWLPVRKSLETVNTPYYARLASVQMKPKTLTNNIAPECVGQGEAAQHPFQFLVEERCPPVHVIVTALTEDDMPKDEETPDQQCIKRLKIRESIQELRRLGVALAIERIVRSGEEEAYYSNLYQIIEVHSMEKSLLVLDNTYMDLVREFKAPGSGSFLSDKIKSAAGKFKFPLEDWLKLLQSKTVIWLSFDKKLASDLANDIVKAGISPNEPIPFEVVMTESQVTGCDVTRR